MRADLLLAQPNMGRGARVALRASAGVAGVYGVGVALLFWNMNATLKREQTALKTTRQRASEGRAARRRKREEAARMGVVHVAPPTGSGSAEFTEELYRLASASGAGMLSTQFPTSGPGAAPPPPPPPPPSGDNASANNGAMETMAIMGMAIMAEAMARITTLPLPTPAANGDGWKRAPFECNLTGSFSTLQDFLERLTRLPRVVEISGSRVAPRPHRPPHGPDARSFETDRNGLRAGRQAMKTTTKNNPVQVGAFWAFWAQPFSS